MKFVDIFITLIGAFLFGVAPVLSKYLLQKYTRYTIMLLISGIYFSCLLLGLPFYNGHLSVDLNHLTMADSLLFLFHGIFILFIGNITYYYVLKGNSSSLVNALESSSPLITLILAYYLINEEVKPIGILGIVLIVLGVICISQNDKKINISEVFSNRE